MCPLRLILIFLSATLAGFFVLRNLTSHPTHDADDHTAKSSYSATATASNPSLNATSKVGGALNSGFWTLVDMASGRYLWRHLVSSPSSSKDST